MKAQKVKFQTIFSIVMPSYNQAKFITEALDSIINQEGEFFIDIIIKDGGSTDGAVDRIIETEKKLKNFPVREYSGLDFYYDPTRTSIRCLGISFRWSSQKDNGFADAINSGLREIQGQIFSYLNTDDYLLPSALEVVKVAFQSYPEIDAVYGEAWEVDEVGGKIGRYGTKDIASNRLADGNFISQPSMFIKKETVLAAGDFNVMIKNSIDYEYWLRIESLGYKFKYIDQYLSATRIYRDTKTMKYRKQIVRETLAIQLYYGGDISKVDAEFMWGTSFFGKYLFKLLPYRVWRSVFSLMSRIWIFFNKAGLKALGRKLFE